MSDDAPVSRGKFLKSLGSSMTGMALGTGLATAAQALAKRIAAVTANPTPLPASDTSIKDKPNFPPIITSGPNEGRRIALTFDDGPTPGVTDLILDELKQRNLVATFFMIGQQVAAAPELAQRVLAEGHEIGNHTHTHPKLNTLTDTQVTQELQKTQDVFTSVLNYQAAWVRPPFGAFRKNQTLLSQQAGMGVVLWSLDSNDWAQPGEEKITDTILSGVRSGSIIVCHDKFLQTANCIGRVMDELLKQGFSFVTISSLLEPSAKIEPQPLHG